VQNPHPLVVHFPIAFLVAACLATFLHAWLRRDGLRRFARASLFLGTAAAGIAVLTGFLAEQSVAPVARAAEAMGEHRTYGYLVLGCAAALTVLAVLEARLAARAALATSARLLGHAALLLVVVLAAHEGGELVHGFGVGTALTAPGGPLAEKAPPLQPTAPKDAPVPSGSDFR
jgi:uncharacterized membrane protein